MSITCLTAVRQPNPGLDFDYTGESQYEVLVWEMYQMFPTWKLL